jgi:exodeoxyribonuclease-5
MEKLIKSIYVLNIKISEHFEYFDKRTKKIKSLMKDQLELFITIKNFIDNKEIGDNIFFVNSRAGSGKTYLLSTLVSFYLYTNKKIYITSITHKSLRVIKEMLKNENIDMTRITILTIHKLLNAEPKYDKYGKLFFNFRNTIYHRDNMILFIDEASMISQRIYERLTINKKFKIVFFGDNRQLPPVKEKTFIVDNVCNIYSMNCVPRTNKKNLLKIYHLFADFVDNRKINTNILEQLLTNNDNVTLLSRKQLNNILFNYKDNKHSFKMLCYTNKRKDYWNQYIRKFYYPNEEDEFVENEQLVSKKSFVYNNNTIFSTKIFTVKKVVIVDKLMYGVKFCCYDIICNENNFKFSLIHKKDKKRYTKVITDFYNNIIKMETDLSYRHKLLNIFNIKNIKGKSYEGYIRELVWEHYYKNIYNIDCPLDYSYCLTIHKAQGSTFDTVIVDLTDIKISDDLFQYKLLYTAVTRPSNKLYLLYD